MKGEGAKGKGILLLEILGAAAAVAMLLVQLLWSRDCEPTLRKGIEALLMVLVAVSAVLLAMKATKAKKEKKEND